MTAIFIYNAVFILPCQIVHRAGYRIYTLTCLTGGDTRIEAVGGNLQKLCTFGTYISNRHRYARIADVSVKVNTNIQRHEVSFPYDFLFIGKPVDNFFVDRHARCTGKVFCIPCGNAADALNVLNAEVIQFLSRYTRLHTRGQLFKEPRQCLAG